MADTTITPLQLTINPLEQSKPQGPLNSNVQTAADTVSSSSSGSFWSGDAPSFKDILDTINPLQHIPIVSSIYEALTGDTQSSGSNVIGGALFGGPIGLVASIFDEVVKQQTGAGVTGNLMAAIEGKPVPALQTNQTTQVADNMPLGANQRAAYNAYVNASMLA